MTVCVCVCVRSQHCVLWDRGFSASSEHSCVHACTFLICLFFSFVSVFFLSSVHMHTINSCTVNNFQVCAYFHAHVHLVNFQLELISVSARNTYTHVHTHIDCADSHVQIYHTIRHETNDGTCMHLIACPHGTHMYDVYPEEIECVGVCLCVVVVVGVLLQRHCMLGLCTPQLGLVDSNSLDHGCTHACKEHTLEKLFSLILHAWTKKRTMLEHASTTFIRVIQCVRA